MVSYLLKTLGYRVTANDFLTFPSVIARATVVNQDQCLPRMTSIRSAGRPPMTGTSSSGRSRACTSPTEDRQFLDSAWSHIDTMTGHKRDLAIAALVLASARRQPRGVFTFTDMRYDDGRRDLRMSLREHFRERAAEYNRVVFDSGQPCTALCRRRLRTGATAL